MYDLNFLAKWGGGGGGEGRMTVSPAASLTGQHCIVSKNLFTVMHVHKTSIRTGNVFICPSNSTSNLPKKNHLVQHVKNNKI